MDTERFHFNNGDAYVHAPRHCDGVWCAIHNPSDHHMEFWPLSIDDSGLMFRECDHGVKHPDPDTARHFKATRGWKDNNLKHECDGCCVEEKAMTA